MDIQPGDVIRMKKPHPCGSVTWEVLRIGQDFRLKCSRCGRQVMMKRTAAEKGVREIIRPGNEEASKK